MSDLREKNEELRGENARLRLQCEHQLAELGQFPSPTDPESRRQVERLAANLAETAEKQGQLRAEREEATRYKAERDALVAERDLFRHEQRNLLSTIETLREERNVAERKLHALSLDTPENLRQLALAHLATMVRSKAPADDMVFEAAREILRATE